MSIVVVYYYEVITTLYAKHQQVRANAVQVEHVSFTSAGLEKRDAQHVVKQIRA